MSPVFRHGRLRLYLLKLLDEAPRHGYEVIRLLQDRFLGVYAPSPGTIYPRLARLEEDGLVTHEEVDGKKVYSITDKGREEIRARLDELADLEEELTESLRDVAREISEDVRDTVRSIREDLASAAREFRNADQGRAPGAAGEAPDGDGAAAGAGRADGRGGTGTAGGAGGSDEARRIREEARRNREQMRSAFRARGRNRSEWAAWQERIGRQDWTGWAPWSDWPGAGAEHSGPAGARTPGAGGPGENPRQPGGPGSRPRGGPAGPFSDLERMALQFATELRSAARQAGDLGERSLSDLRDILTDTLAKVRDEVFTETNPRASTTPAQGKPANPGGAATPAGSAAADRPTANGSDTDETGSEH